jgi:hypothetical protein
VEEENGVRYDELDSGHDDDECFSFFQHLPSEQLTLRDITMGQLPRASRTEMT